MKNLTILCFFLFLNVVSAFNIPAIGNLSNLNVIKTFKQIKALLEIKEKSKQSNFLNCTKVEFVDTDCPCNDPCASMNWNPANECLTIANIGVNCSSVATDVTEWRNDYGSYMAVPPSGQLCNCDVFERLEVTPVCQVVGSNFVLGGDNVQKCPGRCFSRVDFTFPIGASNVNAYPYCTQTVQCLEISPANLLNSGGVMTAYFRSDTPSGTAVSIVKFTYNGNGLNCNNITTQIIQQGKIYKDIWVRRTVTYSDGCDTEVCEMELNIPQLGDECLMELFVNTVNVGNNCNFIGFGASTINLTNPATYQWKYNGINIPSNYAPNIFCLSGQPFGTYCVHVTDASGCAAEACRIYQTGSTLGVTISRSGNHLTTNLSNCVGIPFYQWAKWNGVSWVNVGSNTSSYNTLGTQGEYKVTVNCSSYTAIGNYNFIAPCMADVNIEVVSSVLTAYVTGCVGGLIHYLWERQISPTSWVVVQSNNSYSTSNDYNASITGVYRVIITCGSCSDQMQTSYNVLRQGPLPIELISFDSKDDGCGKVTLNWTTSLEFQNQYIEVLRSENGKSFYSLGKVIGNSLSKENAYSFSDTSGFINGYTYYYRLKQVDFNGKAQLHRIISHIYTCNTTTFPVFSIIPNPATQVINIHFEHFKPDVTVKLYLRNINNKIFKSIELVPAISTEIYIDDIPAGLYYIEIIDGENIYTKKFIKIRS